MQPKQKVERSASPKQPQQANIGLKPTPTSAKRVDCMSPTPMTRDADSQSQSQLEDTPSKDKLA